MRAFALQSRPSRYVWAYATLCRPFERTVAYAAWSATNRLPPPHALTSIGSRRQRDREIEPSSLEPMEILRASVAVHWMEDDAPRRQGYTQCYRRCWKNCLLLYCLKILPFCPFGSKSFRFKEIGNATFCIYSNHWIKYIVCHSWAFLWYF